MGFEPGTPTTNPEHTRALDRSAMAPLNKDEKKTNSKLLLNCIKGEGKTKSVSFITLYKDYILVYWTGNVILGKYDVNK